MTNLGIRNLSNLSGMSVGFFYEWVSNLLHWHFRKKKILELNVLADEAFPAQWTVSFYPRRSSLIELKNMS